MKRFPRILSSTILIMSLLSSGCATIHVETAVGNKYPCEDLCGKTPRVYGGTVEAYRMLFFPFLCTTEGEETDPSLLLVYPLLLPVLAVDLALSMVADTVILPYTTYKQIRAGNVCDPKKDDLW